MKFITLKSRAKINLSIDILGKRSDGYHLVEMIMQTIDLADIIKINELNTEEIIIKSNSENIPLDEDNIAYKAINLIREEFNIKKGIEVYIEKNIPVAAGMAGGSSNAAAILVGLNELWQLELNEKDLQQLGLNLGADVPFCISGKAAIAKGIGEELTYIEGLDDKVKILVCKPNLFVSTRDVYNGLDLGNIKNRPNNIDLVKNLKDKDIKSLAQNMANVLESVTSSKYGEIDNIESTMMKHKALGSMMSGSGPTVFGLFEDEKEALKCMAELEKIYDEVYLVNSSERGVEICG